MAFDTKTVETTINVVTELAKFTTAIITLGILIIPAFTKRLRAVKRTHTKESANILDREFILPINRKQARTIFTLAYLFGLASFFILGMCKAAFFCELSATAVMGFFFVALDGPATRREIAAFVVMCVFSVFVGVGSAISAGLHP